MLDVRTASSMTELAGRRRLWGAVRVRDATQNRNVCDSAVRLKDSAGKESIALSRLRALVKLSDAQPECGAAEQTRCELRQESRTLVPHEPTGQPTRN
jgi:hypothetical protein